MDYEALFGPGLNDLPFYREHALRVGGSVLELGCGTGRLLWPLCQAGAAMQGLDRSVEMLAACKKQGAALKLKAPLHLGDWLNFNLGQVYAAILLPFNGLQHIGQAEDLHSFFQNLRNHLAPGGIFVFDVHLPQAAILARDPDEHFGVEDGPFTSLGEQVVAEKSNYDAVSQILTQAWTLAHPEGSTRALRLALRQFFPQELQNLLTAQGFKVLGHYGDFDSSPLQSNSLKQVLYVKMT